MATTLSPVEPPPVAVKKVLLLIGPPGCGKGTQASRISKALAVPAVSTGEMIRAEMAAGTELGRVAAGVTITGGLLSDDLVNRIVESRLAQADCAAGVLLDGYPRSVAQALFLDELLSRTGLPAATVVFLDVPFEPLVARTCMRRHCSQCGRIFNLGSNPPAREGACDACGAELLQRPDDCEDTLRSRLRTYQKLTQPVLDHYSGSRLHTIAGGGTPEEVYQRILEALK